jgi:glucose-1-phosphate thymidylyltransferase
VKAILFAHDEPVQADRRLPAAGLFELPLYDQPALQYAIANLISWGIRQIQIVGPATRLKRVLDDGLDYGIHLSYTNSTKKFDLFSLLQKNADWIEGQSLCLMSAHNFFWGDSLSLAEQPTGTATVVAKRVSGYEQYSWLEIDGQPWRVPDLGFYHPDVVEVSRSLRSSGSLTLDLELLNRYYAGLERLEVVRWGGEVVWCDLRDLDSLWPAAQQACAWEEMTESKAACLEELALHMGLIDVAQALKLYEEYPPGRYRDYLGKAFVACGIWAEEQRGLRLVEPLEEES